MPTLTVDEARDRAAAVTVTSYDIALDLTRGPEHFGSHTVIEFAVDGKPGDDGDVATFVDIQAHVLTSIQLDDSPVDVALVSDGRLALTAAPGPHRLVVEGLFAYSHDGEGLHRAVDPEDKQAYTYAMTFLPGAPRIFACFDQPDLKAVYRVDIAAPDDWTVLGNGAAEQVSPGRWRLAETKPLSTYFATLVAGPYHSVTAEHDGIRLGLHCRQSLAEYLDQDADELFEVTGQCFDEYHRLFGIRYPFGEYHQAFVPEFNAGAMENPGCVTFDDNLVFRAQATDSLRATRANVVAHEMAHQWFGDLVTMRWWDDLWLNESFAEYMGYRVTAEVTRFDDVWIEYAYNTKAWGLAADQRGSTHPIAGNGAADAEQALTDFDGISYSKGTAALRQLNVYLGDEAFLAGVVEHLTTHAYGNATLADLLGSWERASGKDVRRWAQAWLRSSGVDTITAEPSGDRVMVRRTSGSADGVRRPHAFDVTAYDASGRGRSVSTLVTDDDVAVDLTASPQGVLLADSGDATWAKVCLDPTSLERLPQVMSAIEDPLARAVLWGSLREGVLDASLDPDVFLRCLEANAAAESDLGIEYVLAGRETSGALGWVGTYLPTDDQRRRLAALTAALVDAAEPGSNRQLIVVRTLIELSDDVDLLAGWLDGSTTPRGVRVDDNFRWRLLRALSALGARDLEDVAAEQQRDPSSQGALHALQCRASMPDADTKAEVWRHITADAAISNHELYALAGYFFLPCQDALTAPYVSRYFAEMPATTSFRTGWVVERSVLVAYPQVCVDARTLTAAEQALGRSDLSPGVRRSLADSTDDLRQVLTSRERYAG